MHRKFRTPNRLAMSVASKLRVVLYWSLKVLHKISVAKGNNKQIPIIKNRTLALGQFCTRRSTCFVHQLNQCACVLCGLNLIGNYLEWTD